MIRHSKLPHSPSLIIEDLFSAIKSLGDGANDDSDELGVLVKHALNTNTPEATTPNSTRIWSKLSRRVRGPFGSLALEGPLISGEEQANKHCTNAPFTVSDEQLLMPANAQETNDQNMASTRTTRETAPFL